MEPCVNQNEILAAIQEATKGQPQDDRFFTAPQLTKVAGHGEKKVREACKTLVEQGILEYAKGAIQTGWGYQVVAGYRIVAKAKKK